MAGFNSILVLIVATCGLLARAHMVMTYPGWRGNNLYRNGTAPEDNPNTLGIDYDDGVVSFPYGQQWMYPCGGMPMTTNRTKWPYGGGAVSVQPGWYLGHQKALIYMNIGITQQGQAAPPNYSHIVVPPFQITGPNNSDYKGQFCLPQVRMPANLSLAAGDNITIQVIQTAQFGAALYSCVDVTLTDPTDPDLVEVTSQNCYNSSDIGFNLLFTSTDLSAATSLQMASSSVLFISTLVAFAVAFVL